ncbi:Peptidoglycan-binding lysin domain-containing protein [Gemmatirosa kalamazoonensis]|uniref:Peptidoglycan-binding lysin domain-containing protein n=1 Tax=Gemmatirosa kalamazoonensis TaxID=861299 RepID=W0RKJ0_9BACT|nr:LysM domain-containing protein [Gemmatirosa kalamazoonensis]AHG91271.1 Peptidoglycan-binding lysin domain-containing protein [Gemmatirosa kalamazoonensis]
MTSSPAPVPSPSPRTPLVGPSPNQTMELPAYAPGELLDVPSPDITLPTRGIRPRRHSRVQRILIALSGGTLLIVIGGVLALATLLSPLGARSAARRLAEQELRSELEEGEHVIGQAYVSQRNWWDNFRESFGVLAATDRRLLFVGVPPASWLRRSEDDGPPELRVQSLSYDAPFTAQTRRILLFPGVVIQTTSGDLTFLVPRGEASRVDEIERVVERAQVAQSQATQQEQLGRIAPPPPPPPVYVTHVVHSGESVTSIARTYRTTPDVIRQLNRLPTDRIRIGQRLRVPQAPNAAPPQPQPANVP